MIFLHIPKTAGASLLEALARTEHNVVPIYGGKPVETFDEAAAGIEYHDTIFFGHVQYGVHERLGVPPIYGTVLRNPVDRVISWYRHQARETGLRFHDEIESGLTLVDMLKTERTRETSNHATHVLSGGAISSAGGRNAVETAKRNLDSFAFVALTESLAKDLPRLSALLGVPWLRVSRYNVAPQRTDAWAEDVREIVAEHNQLDLELYEHAKSIAREQRADRNSFLSLLRHSGPRAVVGHYAWYHLWQPMPLPLKIAAKAIVRRSLLRRS